MPDAAFLQDVRYDLGLLYSRGANQYRATVAMQGLYLVRQRAPLGILGHIDQVLVVDATVFTVGRYRRDFQSVDLQELLRLCGCGARHPAHPVVQAEVILKRYRRVSASLLADAQLLFRFDCLVQAVG